MPRNLVRLSGAMDKKEFHSTILGLRKKFD